MKLQDNDTYVLNEFGEIDLNYYINRAHQLRSQAMKESTLKLGNAIKQGFHSLVALVHKMLYRVTPA